MTATDGGNTENAGAIFGETTTDGNTENAGAIFGETAMDDGNTENAGAIFGDATLSVIPAEAGIQCVNAQSLLRLSARESSIATPRPIAFYA